MFLSRGHHPIFGAVGSGEGEIFELGPGHRHIDGIGGNRLADILGEEHESGVSVRDVLEERHVEPSFVCAVGLGPDGCVSHDVLIEQELGLQGGQVEIAVADVHGESEPSSHVCGFAGALHGHIRAFLGEDILELFLAGHQGGCRCERDYSCFNYLFHFCSV